MASPNLMRAAAGDAAATAACVDAHGALVWSLARRFARSPAEAEEATRAVFRAVFAAAARADPAPVSEAVFVAMIARRTLIDRRRARQGSSSADGETPAGLETPAPAPVQLDLEPELAAVAQALAALPAERRRALELAVRGGLTHDQIARVLGVPVESARTHVRRGLLVVRAAMYAGAAAGEPS